MNNSQFDKALLSIEDRIISWSGMVDMLETASTVLDNEIAKYPSNNPKDLDELLGELESLSDQQKVAKRHIESYVKLLNLKTRLPTPRPF